MKAKPKTARDLRNNDKILRALNANHQDDLFKSNKKQTGKQTSKKFKESSNQRVAAKDILEELFDSDSENNISLNSARTPITAFFNRTKLQNDENDENMENNEEKENQSRIVEPVFQEHAYLARKSKEKSSHKLMKTIQQSPLMISKKAPKKYLETATNAISRYSQEVRMPF